MEKKIQDKENAIDSVVDEVLASFSFKYKTLDDSIKTICCEGIEYTYDASSLLCLEHNMNKEEYSYFCHTLTSKYDHKNYNHEVQKERLERASLANFLLNTENEYRDYEITKTVHPDFILSSGYNYIGVEVVKLTIPSNEIMGKISKENFGYGKKADDIRVDAIKKHGEKAKEFEYFDINGSAVIGSGSFDVRARKAKFVSEIKEKYDKYHDLFINYDEFIILADAEQNHSIEITSEYDVGDVVELLKASYPEVSGFTLVVIWDNDEGRISVSRYLF